MRTFVAVEIGDGDALDSIKKVQGEIKINAKPVDGTNMHFTLLFLGEIAEEMVSKVSEQLKGLEFSPFDVSFEGVGAFPKPRFPRVVWVGVKEGSAELVNLAKAVQERLGGLGFKADKPFKPHMTIFRIKGNTGDITDQLSRHAGEKFGTARISEIKFKKSVLTPQGPVYSDLEVVPAR